jgi:hypothetical protein
MVLVENVSVTWKVTKGNVELRLWSPHHSRWGWYVFSKILYRRAIRPDAVCFHLIIVASMDTLNHLGSPK